MTLSRDEVRHVATLARLGLSPGEEEFYAQQLSGILGHIERLRQVDTSAIPPTAQVVHIRNVMRDDEEEPCLPPEEALAGAPRRSGDFFLVPAIQEADPNP